LLGYQVEPHKVMRSLGFTKTGSAVWNQMAELCCSCGLCTLYACPEDLYPKEACDKAKVEMRETGFKFVQQKEVKVHPIKEGRRVPLSQLIMKLKLQDYNVEASYNSEKILINKVRIPLQQHIGKPTQANVKKGEMVEEGQIIGRVPDGELGANIHASISGRVSEVSFEKITIES
jgi:Na+-translocating ferredoxin:NAD+ oxidoreductase RnfC subunit